MRQRLCTGSPFTISAIKRWALIEFSDGVCSCRDVGKRMGSKCILVFVVLTFASLFGDGLSRSLQKNEVLKEEKHEIVDKPDFFNGGGHGIGGGFGGGGGLGGGLGGGFGGGHGLGFGHKGGFGHGVGIGGGIGGGHGGGLVQTSCSTGVTKLLFQDKNKFQIDGADFLLKGTVRAIF
eukprot:Gb_25895 [translate_table: standard]